MLRLFETVGDIRAAQKQLVNTLRSQLPSLGVKGVTFRPSSTELEVFSKGDGRLYFGPRFSAGDKKFWNAYGIYDHTRQKQEITVEINFGIGDRRTEGFFAREGDRTFLLHTGGVGGGRKGVSQATFLPWLKPELVEVTDSDGDVRAGIVVGELGAENLSDRIESFVRSVRSFKDAVKNGLIDDPDFGAETKRWRDYLEEFSGRKRGRINKVFDYVSYHGDVVTALKTWRESQGGRDVKITNSPLIDLLAHRDGGLLEVYEVKTSTERQALYAAIGQVLVHSGGRPSVKRTIVLPEDGNIPADIAATMGELRIGLIRFRIGRNDSIRIVEA